jgi:hypothetical protein
MTSGVKRATPSPVALVLSAALALCACSPISAEQTRNESWARQQAVQVRAVDTRDAVTLGIAGPLDPLGATIAASMVRSMRNEKLDASVLGAGQTPTAGIVVEPHLVLLEAGTAEQRQESGVFTPGGLRIAVDGKALAGDGRVLGEFHATDKSAAAVTENNRTALLDECAFNVGTDVAYMILTGVYDGLDPSLTAAAKRDQEAASLAKAGAAKIFVTPGEANGGRYQMLGQVEWPGKSDYRLDTQSCDAAHLQRAAYARYGSAASAVIGYRTWEEGGATHCSGTVVKYTDEAAR